MNRRTLGGLRRLRWAVRGVLLFGVAASVAANILHARQDPISQAISAWPPLALLLTVELVSRIPMHRKSLATIRIVATAVIAGIAGWVSYWHMQGVAVRYGETDTSAYLLPVSVDGLIVVASICLVELAGRIRLAEDSQDAPGQPTPHQPTRQPAAVAATATPPPAATTVASAPASPPPAASPAALPVAAAADPSIRGPVETARIPTQPNRGEARPTRGNPASRARKPGKKPTGPATASTDAELLAALAEVPRDGDGTVPVRRAAAALGTGPDRARRLLTQAGLRRGNDPTDDPDARAEPAPAG